jgi:hypothetical protein
MTSIVNEIFFELGDIREDDCETSDMKYYSKLLPLYSYLIELDILEHYVSGYAVHIGKLNKPIFGLPKGSYVKLIPISEEKTEIKWVNFDVTDFRDKILQMELKNNIGEEDLNKIIYKLFVLSNFNMYLFEKLGYEIKSKIVTLTFLAEDF